MSDNKKYYYLKLKDNFFDTDEMVILETMPDGIIYSNILLKLYLRSLKNGGKLMINDRIPYNANMIATITRTNIAVVEKAIKIFDELELIEILDNGAIYMLEIQNFIGTSSTEGDRKRNYRKRISAAKELGNKALCEKADKRPPEKADKRPPEIELELELDIELDILHFWNEMGIIKNKKTKKREATIRSSLKDRTIDEIKNSISNYKKILDDKNCFFNYKWNIEDFLKKGVEKFIDYDIAKNNFTIKTKNKINNHDSDF